MRSPSLVFSIVFLSLALAAGCKAPGPAASGIRFAHLAHGGGANPEFAALRHAFTAANPGYDVEWHPSLAELAPAPMPRVVFVQAGADTGTVLRADGAEPVSSELAVGDIVLLRPHETLSGAAKVAALAFTTPDPLPAALPTFLRPDWDPRITDTPGGCAEETGAYRRILLTWLDEKGPYVYHSLNAHRVRITDSFSHYHPVAHGFDEIYLVQMTTPDARVVTSEHVARIEDPGSITHAEVDTLLEEHPLVVGDLVFMPRGTMHRGLGGALVQVISVPGFRPNSEVGLDHHLRAIDERLGLEGEAALPYHPAASTSAVIK